MIQLDSLPAAAEIATTVGAQVSALTSLFLGVVIKLVVDLGKKVSTQLDAAPAPAKALIVVGFGQVAAFVSAKTGIFINPDIAMLDTTLVGATLSVVSMGVHSLVKSVIAPLTSKISK